MLLKQTTLVQSSIDVKIDQNLKPDTIQDLGLYIMSGLMKTTKLNEPTV